MNIHEYQAKELLAKFGVPVPAGYAARSVDGAVAADARLPGPVWVGTVFAAVPQIGSSLLGWVGWDGRDGKFPTWKREKGRESRR